MDAFSAVNSDTWSRLHHLANKRRLSGADADELLRLYQVTSAHLSLLRSTAPESGLSASLSATLAQARTRFTGARSTSWQTWRSSSCLALPSALYRSPLADRGLRAPRSASSAAPTPSG